MADTKNNCLTSDEIIKNNGQVIKNHDGTISVFYNNPSLGLYPVQLTLTCCKALDPNYIFDIDTQTCQWSNIPKTCGFSEPINLIVNPKGDDGTLFFVDSFENEACDLKISFDYLLKIKCENLLNIANPTITTNYASNETLSQINTSQQQIEYLNSQIESLTNSIILLNEEILITPYSMECVRFPIITVDEPVDCVMTVWSEWSTCVKGLQTRTRDVKIEPVNGGTPCPVSTETRACEEELTPTSCVSYTIRNKIITPQVINYTNCDNLPINFTIGGFLTETICNINNNTAFINTTSTPGSLEILSSSSCTTKPTTTPKTTTSGFQAIHPLGHRGIDYVDYLDERSVQRRRTLTRLATDVNPCELITYTRIINVVSAEPCGTVVTNTTNNFDNTGFKTISSVATPDSQLVNTTTTYTSVNYCLTDYGLTVWAGILGPIRYQQFLLGDISNPGYTCDDVIKMATYYTIGGAAIYECDTLFGTKSALIVRLNTLMSQLTSLQISLTNEQNNLIKLQNTLETSTSNTDCLTPTQALESLDIEMHLDIVNSDNSITSVFSAATFPAINLTSDLYKYLTTTGSTGFYICGDPSNTDIGLSDCTTLSLNNGVEETPNVSNCDLLLDELLQELFIESKLPETEYSNFLATLTNNAFASNWLSYSTVITDPKIISLITNKKIKISFKINYSCVDFCLLLDNIVLDKSCKTLERNDITISKNPGFDLSRVVDNKKSWVDTTSITNRGFFVAKSDGTNPFRQTNYNVNDERLVINSKEIDLDISVASAIETDVWCYLNDNYGLLTGVTTCNPCEDFTKDFQDDECFIFMDNLSYNFMDGGINDSSNSLCCGDNTVDFTKLITTDLSDIKTINDFQNFMVSELIDAKNRQTISSYGTLRAIYERYLASANYVNTTSSAFDYVTMDKFSNLIGSYWIDIIEQVIPSTAIWGSVKIYTNTIFDEQKFKYKEYTALLCDKPLDFIELNKTNHIKGIFCGSEDVNILQTVISTDNTIVKTKLRYSSCDTIYLAQMNAGSEFIGSIKYY